MASLETNLRNRSWLRERLRAEVIGPDPSGMAVDVASLSSRILTWEEFRAPKRQENGEEILWQDAPIKRYGAGMLFPQGVTEDAQLAEEVATTPTISESEDPGPDVRADELLERRASEQAPRSRIAAEESENYDVSQANAHRPSAMGLSFLADVFREPQGMRVEVNCATYSRMKVRVRRSESPDSVVDREIWLRSPIRDERGKPPAVEISRSRLDNGAGALREWLPGLEGELELVVVPRSYDSPGGQRLLLMTVCLVNRRLKDAGRVDESCFFQCQLRVRGQSNVPWILPYPEPRIAERQADDDEEVARLLYRDRHTFAIGHGCAADWLRNSSSMISEVWTDCMPSFETPTTSPDLTDEDGTPIKVSMQKLAGLDPRDDGSAELDRLVDAYGRWIDGLEDLETREPPVPDDLKETAGLLIKRCRACLRRISEGLSYLRSQDDSARSAREAFALSNNAMLIAQLRASREVRTPGWSEGRLTWDREISNPDPAQADPRRGYWRAFQIAFLLMSLRGICEPNHEDRDIVDLIWFPTGGGKTEAYLGLTAFAIFFHRLIGQKSGGADVLMRYTLRLLTAQQFQRAGLLFCAMEHLRRQPQNRERLGETPFRVGMWVGGDATPNTRSDARAALRRLQRNPDAENPFPILKCPWCNAKFGSPNGAGASVRRSGRRRDDGPPMSVYGYMLFRPRGRQYETVVFRCVDPRCEFGFDPINPCDPLPIVVIDEDLLDDPPDLVIGTVDKFAMLTWKPETRAIFGIGGDGGYVGAPPSLIIQDELHLISGPLGSMVGAYEAVIERLCVREHENQRHRPKIVASTATISRASDQVRALYARERMMLFPPPGLEADDSFFARKAIGDDGTPKPGRLYVGVLAPGHNSQQTTQARVFATLLQYPAVLDTPPDDESARDPWWTLVAFFNSLRELGGAATLLVADTRDYLRVILNRHGYQYSQIRQLLNWEELTSRIRGDKIPLAIQNLEIPFRRDKRGYVTDTIEVCLASNIIEVGVDIDRLALMAIVGQPKTTSQYIQVSSRVGRNESAPGLVVVTYSQSKPRDRSHYERFRTYHERLYAQVEATSVTPFSAPAVDRSLHGVIVAATRQRLPLQDAASPRPFPLERGSPMRELIESMIRFRVGTVDPSEAGNVMASMMRRLEQWKAWDPREFGGFGAPPENAPLMYPAGSQPRPEWNGHGWPTLTSLRDVDATCEAEVTTFYNEPGDGDDPCQDR